MPKLKSIDFYGQRYDIYYRTGKVVSTTKNSTTHTYSTGGGYNSNTGQYDPTRYHTSTNIQDQIFIVDNDGQEHAIQVNNFNVACREGNEITAIWVIKEGLEEGPYTLIHNHSTNQQFVRDSSIQSLLERKHNLISGKKGCLHGCVMPILLIGGVFMLIFGWLFREFSKSVGIVIPLTGLLFLVIGIVINVQTIRNKKNKFENFKNILRNIPFSELRDK